MIERIAGGGDILLLCDHASNAVPGDIDLRIEPELMDRHIAWDIGAGSLTRALARRLGAPAVLATVSRLVIDLNRAVDQDGLVPVNSDGHPIPGNRDIDVSARIARFHAPYHRAIGEQVCRLPPRLIVAIHSFTPCLADGRPRPWHVGILYGPQQRVAAALALDFLRKHDFPVGDNQPYPGDIYNATLDTHAVGGIAAINVEVRNDLIDDVPGVEKWSDILAPMIVHVRNGLAQTGAPAT